VEAELKMPLNSDKDGLEKSGKVHGTISKYGKGLRKTRI